jgi:hypothetical protein
VVACLSLDRSFAGSNPAEDDGIFKGDKICSTTSFGGEVNRRSHLVRFYGMLKNRTGIKEVLLGKIQYFLRYIPPASLLRCQSSGERDESFPLPISFHRGRSSWT